MREFNLLMTLSPLPNIKFNFILPDILRYPTDTEYVQNRYAHFSFKLDAPASNVLFLNHSNLPQILVTKPINLSVICM